MMPDDLILCPFERRITGPHGAILLRKNEQHAQLAAAAIRRRDQPEWSRMNDGMRVSPSSGDKQ